MMKRTLFALMVAGVALLGAPGSAMAGTSGHETFRTLTVGSAPPTTTRRVVAVGPTVIAVGTERILGQQDLGNGSTRVDASWVFPKGTLFVTMVVSPNFQGPPTPPTCVGTANITGTYQITGGTGGYMHAAGGGTLTGVGRVFAQFDRSSGMCSMDVANLFLNQRTFQGTFSF